MHRRCTLGVSDAPASAEARRQRTAGERGHEELSPRSRPRRRTIEVLRGASMEARAGELIGLVGENGSGKSTLLKIIVGMLERDGGSVERTEKPGYCPQVPLLWGKLTSREHFDLFASAYELGAEEVGEAQARLLPALQFERYLDYRVEELSGGTRQKLNLALSLMHDPDLLLLDKPYSGFDWGDLPTLLGDERRAARRRNVDRGRLPPDL